MVSVSTRFRESYQFEGGLEQALIDVVRIGAAGHDAGVRQIAARLLRSVPPEVSAGEEFREAMSAALVEKSGVGSLRFGRSRLPTDEATTHPLVSVDPDPSGDGLALASSVQVELDDIVSERLRGAEFEAAGVARTRAVLFTGPPGVGKTLAAKWIAMRIGLPLVSIDLATVMSSYLGSSGRNIRSALEFARSGSCVLLLDEFDALAKSRDDEADVGELRRIVNVVLLELDRWPESGLLIAATNHPHLLDPAVERRFDTHVDFPMPDQDERRRIVAYSSALVDEDLAEIIPFVVAVTEGWSGSDLARLLERARRRALLRGASVRDVLIREFLEADIDPGPGRDALWAAASHHLGVSNRQIACFAGVSHPTVGVALRRAANSS